MPTKYSDQRVEYLVSEAVLIGHIDRAVRKLRVPENTLRGWLRARGYRTNFGEIYHPADLDRDKD